MAYLSSSDVALDPLIVVLSLVKTESDMVCAINSKAVNLNIACSSYVDVVAVCIMKYIYQLHLTFDPTDITPSKIFINRKGEIKLYDLIISKHWMDDFVRALPVDIKPYMAVSVLCVRVHVRVHVHVYACVCVHVCVFSFVLA